MNRQSILLRMELDRQSKEVGMVLDRRLAEMRVEFDRQSKEVEWN